ncbi:hypothetical protein HPP92_007269 [Vanilla planifolia]|uniref:Pentatricopeptide repeat-containing protein n=1 Tax=Vanilla planifolia TaxID=51239 RepID=A0A835VBP9_VANPL|nr:hypothetical protein HPP92_007269 [Vanilla planifolia]
MHEAVIYVCKMWPSPCSSAAFDELPQRTIFAWNALIWAYASLNETERAIRLYCNMRILGEVPDGCTFACVLKACRSVDHLYYGLDIHSLSVKCGLISCSFVANGLINMYGKCGQFDLAEKLFDGIPKKRDLVLWNSIVSCSIQAAKYAKAISLFREMHKTGMTMDSYTAVSVLQACAELSLVKLGREVQGSLLRCRGSLELYEGNALVIMYAKNGFLPHAVQVFDLMNEKDNISWNSLLSAFVQNCFYWNAIELFCRMLEMGYKPDPISLVVVASASARLGNFLNGMEIHGYALKQGHDSDIQIANTLMAMYTKCSLVKNCELLFQRILNKDVISWTTMIACYAQNGYYTEAIEFFRRVQVEGTDADPLMIGSILQACSCLVSPSFLKQIHGYTIRHDLLDLVLKNTVIDVYGECGMVGHAVKVFEGIKDKDVVSWTSMITCYVRNRLFNDALSLFGNMITANVHPDVVALLGMLSAAAGLASLTKGKEVHAFLIRRSMCVDGNVSSLLVDMYARCGKIDESFKVFKKIGCKDLVLWTSIVDACGMHGMGREAVDLFERMEEAGIVPDHVAFLALLYACSHSRLVVEGNIFLKNDKKL